MLCLSEIQSPNALRASIFRQVCGALLLDVSSSINKRDVIKTIAIRKARFEPFAVWVNLVFLSFLRQPAKYKLDPPHYDGVQSLALLGNKLFSGSRDNSIKKWDLSTRQMEQVGN